MTGSLHAMFFTKSCVSVIVACVCAFAIAACGGGSSSSDGGGGTQLRIGQPAFTAFDTTNPFTSGLIGQFIASYPTLVTYDKKLGTLQPGLATRWESSNDGRTWTFTLHEGAKWSDDHPMTARDVAFTINTIIRYKNGGAAGVISFTVPDAKQARAIDETTVAIDFKKPSASALDGLSNTVILPEHVWARYATGADGQGLTTFENKPPIVAGGPYVWTRWEEDSFAFFERNRNWYGKQSPVASFGVQIFTDEDAMITALRAGKIDAVDYISPGNIGALRGADGLTVSSVPGLSVDSLFVNVNPKKRSAPELTDARVREALDMAIDRQQIVETVYGGNATPGVSLWPAVSPFADDSLEPVPFDVDGANQILDELGYERGSDGVRRANGEPMDYELVFPTFMRGAGDREFRIVRDGWLKLGVKVSQRTTDDSAYVPAIMGPDNKYLNMQLAMGSQQPSADPSAFSRSMTCGAWGSNNATGYCQPEYDRMWEAQQAETDPQKRQVILDRMWRYIQRQHAAMALVYPNWTFAHSDKWTGFREGPSGWFATTGGNFMDDVKPVK